MRGDTFFLLVGIALAAGQASSAKDVARTLDITIDHVARGEPGKPGDRDQMRVVYDDAAIDPKTGRAKLLNVQHPVSGGFAPLRPDPADMPLNDAWIDLSTRPASVHFTATVTHGKRIVIVLDERTRRLSLRAGTPDGELLKSGTYVVSATTLEGPEIERAAGR